MHPHWQAEVAIGLFAPCPALHTLTYQQMTPFVLRQIGMGLAARVKIGDTSRARALIYDSRRLKGVQDASESAVGLSSLAPAIADSFEPSASARKGLA